MTRKSSATDSPTTHTIRSWPSTTRGSESLISLGILRSTRKSWSFFRCPSPRGRKRSPRRRDRIASGSVSGSAATTTSAARAGPGPPGPRDIDPLGRHRPSLIIERHLTRNRQRKPKRVLEAGIPPARSRWSEHDHPAGAHRPLTRQIDRFTFRRLRELQQPVGEVESDETSGRQHRQRVPRDTRRKRRMERPQRGRVNLDFSACHCLRRSNGQNSIASCCKRFSSSRAVAGFPRQHAADSRRKLPLEVRDELVADTIPRDRQIGVAGVGRETPELDPPRTAEDPRVRYRSVDGSRGQREAESPRDRANPSREPDVKERSRPGRRGCGRRQSRRRARRSAACSKNA